MYGQQEKERTYVPFYCGICARHLRNGGVYGDGNVGETVEPLNDLVCVLSDHAEETEKNKAEYSAEVSGEPHYDDQSERRCTVESKLKSGRHCGCGLHILGRIALGAIAYPRRFPCEQLAVGIAGKVERR